MPKLKTLLTIMVELHEELPDVGAGNTDTEKRYFVDISRALMAVPQVVHTSLEKAQLFFKSPENGGVELRACPFCGMVAPVHIEECTMDPCPDAECEYCCEGLAYHVICDPELGGCGGSMGYADDKEAAAEDWNRRVSNE